MCLQRIKAHSQPDLQYLYFLKGEGALAQSALIRLEISLSFLTPSNYKGMKGYIIPLI